MFTVFTCIINIIIKKHFKTFLLNFKIFDAFTVKFRKIHQSASSNGESFFKDRAEQKKSGDSSVFRLNVYSDAFSSFVQAKKMKLV